MRDYGWVIFPLYVVDPIYFQRYFIRYNLVKRGINVLPLWTGSRLGYRLLGFCLPGVELVDEQYDMGLLSSELPWSMLFLGCDVTAIVRITCGFGVMIG